MARVRNRTTGVVVSTSDDVAGRLSRFEWESAESKSAPKKTAEKSEK